MRKRYITALGIAGVSTLAVMVGWLNRETIIRNYVEDTLAAANVRADYDIDYIGLMEQRLTNIRIGDPARPDLAAKSMTLHLGVGLTGPTIEAVEADGVRLRGRWDGQRLQLGDIDHLLPQSDGSPPSLPDIALRLRDSAAAVDTPWGLIAFGATGDGNLGDGFDGRVAVVAPHMTLGDCAARNIGGETRVSIRDAIPSIRGPLGIGKLECPKAQTALNDVRLGLNGRVPLTLRGVEGKIGLDSAGGSSQGVQLDRLHGSLQFAAASLAQISGKYLLTGNRGVSDWGSTQEASLSGDLDYSARKGFAVTGNAQLTGTQLSPKTVARLEGWSNAGAGTPLHPLMRKFAQALAQAGRGVSATSQYRLHQTDSTPLAFEAGHITVDSGSGAHIALERPDSIVWSPAQGARFALHGQFGGGGLPNGEVNLSGRGPHWQGVVTMAPYAADNARLALTPVQFRTNGVTTHIATAFDVSGPLAGGRVEALRAPLAAQITANGAVTLAPGCQTLAWNSIEMSGARLNANQLALCSDPGRPLQFANGALRGAMRTGAVQLAGATGQTPFQLALQGARLDADRRNFVIDALETRLGAGDAPTRIACSRVTGQLSAQGMGGQFEGTQAQIAAVPLLMRDGAGQWSYANGLLQLNAATLHVADTQSTPRFEPVVSNDAVLTLRDGVIRVTGGLQSTERPARLADVEITHQLATTTGRATINVAGLHFTRQGLQPAILTQLAKGVVADVEGIVRGRGLITWNSQGVQSSGEFTTDATDLAAAFGPVKGMAGTIRFDDLLSLRTAPGQEVRLASVNPGVDVTDGIVRYQLLPDQKVQIESGYWPFAGGELTMRPTLLDFGADVPRHLTFDVKGVDAALFLARYEFDNITATGVFDGTLPTVFTAEGGRVESGILTARGGGSLAYIGELSNRDLGMMANIAFGALRSLRYNALDIRMNGRIDGDMLTEVSFGGLAQGEGVKNSIFTRPLRNLPIKFDININAPFRQLLTSARGMYDPTLLVKQNLGALMREQQIREQRAAEPVQLPLSDAQR